MRRMWFTMMLAACGDGAAVLPDASSSDAPPGVVRPVIGTIEVVESRFATDDAEYRSGRVSARLYDGSAPRWHREVMRAGACSLRKYMTASCTPACSSGLCVEGVCEPWPRLLSGGRLTVAGLTVPLRIDPSDGNYYPDALPEELFADDATVTASLAGAAVPAMSLSARGVPSLVTAIQQGKITVPYPAGQDFVVRWTPAAGDSRVRLTLNSNNDGHGFPYLAILECEVADSVGEVAIPAALLDAFPETRAWRVCAGSDCPPSRIRRYQRATHALGDNDIELVVASELEFLVEHDLP